MMTRHPYPRAMVTKRGPSPRCGWAARRVGIGVFRGHSFTPALYTADML